MNIDDCYQLGFVTKTHGLQGNVVFLLDVDDPEEYQELDSVFIEVEQTLVPYFIDTIRLQKDKAIVSLEDVTTLESAAKLVGCRLFLPLDNLPELEEDQFYYHEIVGYRITDESLGELGEVATVYEVPHQHLIAMMYRGREVLIPVNDAIVKGVDHQKREISVSLPEGLLDIYLDEGSSKNNPERDADEGTED
jgi:16S rRNA processing protein RimM